MGNQFDVVVTAGTCRSGSDRAVQMPHRWTPEGVSIEADFTGGHLLHLAAAGCVLNDLYREAATLGIELDGVRVSVSGGFDTSTWQSTGITYSVRVDSGAPAEEIDRLLDIVDAVAEIPRALRSGTVVRRVVT
jgi:uncharacterized OsmC-like protein